MKINTILIIIVIFGILVLARGLDDAIEKSQNNQNIMLCESAKISGNKDYLKKCSHYYQTGDINYMIEENAK